LAEKALEVFEEKLATDLWPVTTPFSFGQGICLLFVWLDYDSEMSIFG